MDEVRSIGGEFLQMKRYVLATVGIPRHLRDSQMQRKPLLNSERLDDENR